MNGQVLTPAQRAKMFDIGLNALASIDASVRWISAEPLTFDISTEIKDANIQWLVIGAASRGSLTFQPSYQDVRKALDAADARQLPVFLKENLRRFTRREQYPPIPTVAAPMTAVQAALF
jgi:protein gp37